MIQNYVNFDKKSAERSHININTFLDLNLSSPLILK